jgi:hypothetical protein
MNDIWKRTRTKAPLPHDHVHEYMETRTLKHEKGVCRCPECVPRWVPTANYYMDDEDDIGGYGDYDDDEQSNHSDESESYGNGGSDNEEMENVEGGQHSSQVLLTKRKHCRSMYHKRATQSSHGSNKTRSERLSLLSSRL